MQIWVLLVVKDDSGNLRVFLIILGIFEYFLVFWVFRLFLGILGYFLDILRRFGYFKAFLGIFRHFWVFSGILGYFSDIKDISGYFRYFLDIYGYFRIFWGILGSFFLKYIYNYHIYRKYLHTSTNIYLCVHMLHRYV